MLRVSLRWFRNLKLVLDAYSAVDVDCEFAIWQSELTRIQLKIKAPADFEFAFFFSGIDRQGTVKSACSYGSAPRCVRISV